MTDSPRPTGESRAIGLHRHGGAEVLVDGTVALPALGPTDVLVGTHALGINPVDVYFRSTPWEEIARAFPKQIPAPRTLRVPGGDFAGVVEAVGTAAGKWSVGDLVFGSAPAMAAAGAYREHLAVDARLLAALPRTLSADRAAAWPMVGITAWEALFDILRIRPDGSDRGASLLIIGATGGTGSAAIQLAKQVAGLSVTATSGSEPGRSWCLSLGADAVVDHKEPLTAQLPGTCFDFILCSASAAAYLGTMAELVAPFGHICAVVADLDPVPFAGLRLKSASFGVEFMGLRPMGPQIGRHGEILTRISRLIDEGRLADMSRHRLGPVNAETMREAHELVERGGQGKVTVSGWP